MADHMHPISEQGPDFVAADHQVVVGHPSPELSQSSPPVTVTPTAGHTQALTGSRSHAHDVGQASPSTSPPAVSASTPTLSSPTSPTPPTPHSRADPSPVVVTPATAGGDAEKIVVGASTLSTCSEPASTFDSPYGNPEQHQGSATSPSPTPRPTTPKSPTSPRSVSRLCFPFVTTRSKPKPKAVPPPRPPPRHKYTPSIHSPLSPFSSDRPALAHQRHKYADHGRSRLALDYVKELWATREDIWKGNNPADDHPPALVKATSDRSPNKAERLGHETMPAPQEPITIHPRRGDIQALRDPYCVDIDRCFVDLPPWTMSKVLWMSDMHKMIALKSRAAHRGDDEPSDSESDYDTCTSMTGFNSDSDATLVESESESDLPRLLTGARKPGQPLVHNASAKVEQFTDPEGGKCLLASFNQSTIRGRQQTLRPSVIPITATTTTTTATTDKNTDWPLSVYLRSRPGSSSLSKASSSSSEYDWSWATNWYQRWDLLTDLSREDWDNKQTLFSTNSYRSGPPLGQHWDPRSAFHHHHSATSRSIPGRRFFISGGSGHHHHKDHHDPWNHRIGPSRRIK